MPHSGNHREPPEDQPAQQEKGQERIKREKMQKATSGLDGLEVAEADGEAIRAHVRGVRDERHRVSLAEGASHADPVTAKEVAGDTQDG